MFSLTVMSVLGFSLCVFTAGNALARTTIVSLTTKESGGSYGTAAGMTYSMDNLGRIIGPFSTLKARIAASSIFFNNSGEITAGIA